MTHSSSNCRRHLPSAARTLRLPRSISNRATLPYSISKASSCCDPKNERKTVFKWFRKNLGLTQLSTERLTNYCSKTTVAKQKTVDSSNKNVVVVEPFEQTTFVFALQPTPEWDTRLMSSSSQVDGEPPYHTPTTPETLPTTDGGLRLCFDGRRLNKDSHFR